MSVLKANHGVSTRSVTLSDEQRTKQSEIRAVASNWGSGFVVDYSIKADTVHEHSTWMISNEASYGNAMQIVSARAWERLVRSPHGDVCGFVGLGMQGSILVYANVETINEACSQDSLFLGFHDLLVKRATKRNRRRVRLFKRANRRSFGN